METYVLKLLTIAIISYLFLYKFVTYRWKGFEENYNFIVEITIQSKLKYNSYDYAKFQSFEHICSPREHGCSLREHDLVRFSGEHGYSPGELPPPAKPVILLLVIVVGHSLIEKTHIATCPS
jgi:hypothetical protein